MTLNSSKSRIYKIIIIIIHLYTCLLNSAEDNYKISMSQEGNKEKNTHKQNKAICAI
jgi:hypothetical protein